MIGSVLLKSGATGQVRPKVFRPHRVISCIRAAEIEVRVSCAVAAMAKSAAAARRRGIVVGLPRPTNGSPREAAQPVATQDRLPGVHDCSHVPTRTDSTAARTAVVCQILMMANPRVFPALPRGCYPSSTCRRCLPAASTASGL